MRSAQTRVLLHRSEAEASTRSVWANERGTAVLVEDLGPLGVEATLRAVSPGVLARTRASAKKYEELRRLRRLASPLLSVVCLALGWLTVVMPVNGWKMIVLLATVTTAVAVHELVTRPRFLAPRPVTAPSGPGTALICETDAPVPEIFYARHGTGEPSSMLFERLDEAGRDALLRAAASTDPEALVSTRKALVDLILYPSSE